MLDCLGLYHTPTYRLAFELGGFHVCVRRVARGYGVRVRVIELGADQGSIRTMSSARRLPADRACSSAAMAQFAEVSEAHDR